MSITSVNDIATALAIAQRIRFYKTFGTAKAAGAFQSGWLAAGFPGAGAASPAYTAGAGYTCDRTTTGALAQVNAAVQNWLARLQAVSTQVGTLFIADRLWSCSGMGFAAGTYTVTTPGNLPARIADNGLGCELWVENFVAAGNASGTLTANYVRPGGGAEAGVIAAVVSAPYAGQMQPIPLQAGAVGVQQLTSIVTSNTWTSGSFGITILKVLAQIELPIANAGVAQDWARVLAAIPADACLMFFIQAGITTGANIMGSAWIIDK